MEWLLYQDCDLILEDRYLKEHVTEIYKIMNDAKEVNREF